MASTFCVCPHPLTTKGGVRFKVGWAAHIRSCSGRCFGCFGGWGCFCDYWHPFVFMLASVGCQWTGGYSRRWVVCLADCFDSWIWGGVRGWLTMVGVMRKGV